MRKEEYKEIKERALIYQRDWTEERLKNGRRNDKGTKKGKKRNWNEERRVNIGGEKKRKKCGKKKQKGEKKRKLNEKE